MTRNFFYSALSAGSAALMLLLLSLAGNSLGPDGYGAFRYALAIGTIAEVFMDLGLHQITIRAIAREPGSARRLFYNSLVLKLLPGVGMVIVFGALAYLLRPEPALRHASLLMLAAAAMRSYLLTARGIFQGLELFGHDALVTTADRVLLLVACGIALLNGADVVTTCIVFLVTRVVTAGSALLLARAHVGGMTGTLDRRLWRDLPIEAVPVGAFLLVLNLYNYVDTLLLGWMTDLTTVGLYGAAYPLYEGLTYATAVLSAVLTPRLSRLWIEDRTGYRRLATKGLIGSAALAVVVAAIAWPLTTVAIYLAFGASFTSATLAFRILLLGLPFVYVIWVLHAVAMSSMQTGVLLTITAVGTALNIILNLVLIPLYSLNGSAMATVVSEAAVMGMLIVGLRRVLLPSSP